MSIITIAETGAEIFEVAETDMPRPEFTGYADGFRPTTLPVGTGNANAAAFAELLDGLLVDMARDDNAASYLARVVAREIRAYADNHTASETIAFVIGIRDVKLAFAGNDLSFLLDAKPVTKALDDVYTAAVEAILAETYADETVANTMTSVIKKALADVTPAQPARRRRRRGGRRRGRR